MRKSNPFVSIPTVPMTVSEQWLAFSHMANHYRKILNVKPRVDTSAPKFSCMDNAPKPSPKLKKIPRKQFTALVERNVPKNQKNVLTTQSQRPKKASKMIDFEFQTLSKAFESPKNTKLGPRSSAYQLVFGPSQLKQSQDDLSDETSDEDAEVYQQNINGMSTMGIAEKIKIFLDQLQEYESNNNQNNHNNVRLINGQKQRIRSREELNESYLARHSRCFVPTLERKAKRNDQYQNNVVDITTTPSSTFNKLKTKIKPTFNSDHSFLINKQKIVRNSNVPSPKLKPTTVQPKSTTKSPYLINTQEILDAQFQKVQIVDNKKRRKAQRCQTPNSVSMGTIRGSDELTESRLLPLSSNGKPSKCVQQGTKQNSCHEQNSSIQIEDHDMSSNWLKEKVDKGLIRINNAYFQLGNGGAPTSTPAFGILNHKDSSRDSAYGFSSGESRITTRESTPEKIGNSSKVKIKKHSPDMGKYKSSLSTVASSTIQDSPVRSRALKSHPKLDLLENMEFEKSKSASVTGTNWMTDNRYLDFLTSVTDDIVSRGIYTNKGLKALFDSHINKHPGLEVAKMVHMLNRLRMDVGVPMDDSLNQLEFGYGSVKYSTPPFFYKNYDENQNTMRVGSKLCNKDSEMSVHELHHRRTEDYHSTDEGHSKTSSCNTSLSVINGGSNDASSYGPSFPANKSNRPASSQSSKDSDISLTESEITNALKEVGFDSETTLDIVKIVSHQNRPQQQQQKFSGLPHNKSSTNVKSKSKSVKSNGSTSRRSTGSC